MARAGFAAAGSPAHLPVAVPPATVSSEEPAPTGPGDTLTAAVSSRRPLAVPKVEEAAPTEPPATSPSSRRPAVPTWLPGLKHRQLIVASVVLVALLVVGTLGVVMVHGDRSPSTAAPPPAGPAGLKSPRGMFVDAGGDLYVADEQNNRVVRVAAADHAVTTVAGTNKGSSFVEGVDATAELLDSPETVSPLAGGGFYVVDHDPATDSRTRIRVVGRDGKMRTVPTEGPLSVSLSAISAIVADPRTGLLYVSTETRVLQLNPATGALTAVAGNDQRGSSGDGGNATQAQLDGAKGLALDQAGKTLYIADCKNGRVRAVDLGSDKITTVAGRSDSSYTGEGGRATDATLSCPLALAVGADGGLYIIESDRFVRKVASEMITTVAGSATGTREDGTPATQTAFSQLRGVAVDAQNRIYLSDGLTRVRLVDGNGVVSTYV